MAEDHWIQKAVSKNPGYLHRVTHTPIGQKIPRGEVSKAAHADNPHERKAAQMAENLSHLRRRHGSCV